MILTDQPGRYIALIVVTPGLLIMGIILVNTYKLKYNKIIGILLIIFSIIFFIYELIWILFYPSKVIKLN